MGMYIALTSAATGVGIDKSAKILKRKNPTEWAGLKQNTKTQNRYIRRMKSIRANIVTFVILAIILSMFTL